MERDEAMKYAVLIGDGMADYPIEKLGGKTILQAARTPAMDYIAAHDKEESELLFAGWLEVRSHSPGSSTAYL